ncbi:MAG: SH3 domain-containing protein [Clostridia bacterium]|nr:SH3 domain-containing protein [Clostridia bacterium]
MKKVKFLRLIAAAVACMMITASALADTALVVTPKGPLNLRKSPTTNSNRIASIPNGTTIEILDIDGEWAKATYNEKTGFVMTKFLRIESQLAGKTVYPDNYALAQLRQEPSASSPALLPVDNLTGVTVDSVENGWLSIQLDEETTVYADAAAFSQQVTEAPSTFSWMAISGETAYDCTLQVDGGEAASLPEGTPVIVTVPFNDLCLVVTEYGCGFLPMNAVRLLGVEDSDEEAGEASPQRSRERAQEALYKNFKGVANESLTAAVSVYRNVYGQDMPYYQVCFYHDDGALAYGALVNAANAKVVYTARYSSYAAPAVAIPEPTATPELTPEPTPAPTAAPEPAAEQEPAQEAPANTSYSFSLVIPGITDLTPAQEEAPEQTPAETPDEQPAEIPAEQPAEAPAGEPEAEGEQDAAEADMEIAYTGDIELGDVEDLEIRAWTDHEANYVIMKDGEMVTSSGSTKHFMAAYRPLTAGEYTAVITVTDEDGAVAAQELTFNVADADIEGILYDYYSQKDGWWLDQSFYTSSLDENGSAVFTLSHGMYRIGIDHEDMLPERIATISTFTDCLTENGVDNVKLVKAAAEHFGFETGDAVTDAAEIVKLLGEGAVFSYTNAQGVTALVSGASEDGQYVCVIDPNPGLTFADGIAEDTVFIQQEDGAITAIRSLEEDPIIRWYINTNSYGVSEYWLKTADIAPLGLLPMQAK